MDDIGRIYENSLNIICRARAKGFGLFLGLQMSGFRSGTY